MKKRNLALGALLLLSSCAPTSGFFEQSMADCNAAGGTHLQITQCYCDRIKKAYTMGAYNVGEDELMRTCAQLKVIAEKQDKGELTEAQAEVARYEWIEKREKEERERREAEESSYVPIYNDPAPIYSQPRSSGNFTCTTFGNQTNCNQQPSFQLDSRFC